VEDHLGRLRCARKDNMQVELNARDVKVHWIYVTEIRVQRLDFVNILRNF
jgi:hypothetical protein